MDAFYEQGSGQYHRTGWSQQESQAGERGDEYHTEMRNQPLIELATKESPVFEIQAEAKNPQRGTWSQLPSKHFQEGLSSISEFRLSLLG